MSDLSIATRELWNRTVVDQIYMATPFVDDLVQRKKVTFSGGTEIKRPMVRDTMEDLMQVYDVMTPLTDGKKDMLETASFTYRMGQLPLRYHVDEYLQNIGADNDVQIINYAKFIVKQGQEAARMWMNSQIFNSGSNTPIADSDKTAFQSIVSALNHDTAYGGLTRTFSSGTNTWFQSADAGALNENVSSSVQDTATTLSIANIRKWVYETDVSAHLKSPADLRILLCPTLFNKIRAEAEGKVQYNPGINQKQGVGKFTLDDNLTFVSVPYLQKTAITRAWLFILNLEEWELRIHTKRNWDMTDFVWQADRSGGRDYWLARMMIAGNFICWKPNSNLWLTSVS